MPHIIFVSLFLLLGFHSASVWGQSQTKKGPFVLSDAARQELISLSSQVEYKDDILNWVKKWRGERIQEGKTYSQDTRFVAYHVGLLTYWFGPYDSYESQEKVLRSLFDLKNQQALSAYQASILVYPIFVRANKAISLSKFGELSSGVSTLIATKEELEEMKQKAQAIENTLAALEQLQSENFQDLKAFIPPDGSLNQLAELGLGEDAAQKMKDLRERYNDKPQEGTPGKNKRGNGLEGPFPADYSFSKGFATLFNILTDILDCTFFQCQIKEKIEKALTLAYMVMPAVMNRIASTLAKFEDSLISDSLDKKLETVADIARYAHMLYEDLKKLEKLLGEPDFQELFQDLDLVTAFDNMGKYGLEIGKVQNICNHIPCEVLTIQNIGYAGLYEDKVKKWLKEKALDEAITQSDYLLKKSGIPILERLDIDAMRTFAKDKDWGKFGKQQAQSALCSYLPKGYAGNCNRIIDGEYEEAARSISAIAIGKQTGLNPDKIQQLLSAVQQEDYTQALKEAALMSTDKYKKYLGAYKDQIDQFLSDPQSYSKQIKGAIETFMESSLDISAAKEIIHAAEYLASQQGNLSWKQGVEGALKQLGVDRTAVQAIMKGNFEVDLQQALEVAAEKVGITSPEAIQAFKQGDWDKAMDAQIDYLNSLPLDENGQVAYIQQRFKNKKEVLKITGEIMKGLANDPDYQQKNITEKKLQK
ncbi:MAG: hypothetical protein AAFU33_16385 [Bacteroidota bacterium]